MTSSSWKPAGEGSRYIKEHRVNLWAQRQEQKGKAGRLIWKESLRGGNLRKFTASRLVWFFSGIPYTNWWGTNCQEEGAALISGAPEVERPGQASGCGFWRTFIWLRTSGFGFHRWGSLGARCLSEVHPSFRRAHGHVQQPKLSLWTLCAEILH